jgi:hypothetical protein
MFGVLVAVWLSCLGMASFGCGSFLGGMVSSLWMGCVITVVLWCSSMGCDAFIGVWHIYCVASPLVFPLWSMLLGYVTVGCMVSQLGYVCGCLGLPRCSHCWFLTLPLQCDVTIWVWHLHWSMVCLGIPSSFGCGKSDGVWCLFALYNECIVICFGLC